MPQVEEYLEQPFSTSATSHPVDMPASVPAGQLLLIAFAHNSSSTTEPTDWDTIGVIQHGAGPTINIFGKLADGTEGGTQVDCVTAVNRRCSAQVYRISGWHSATLPQFAGATGNTAAADPPNLDPTWPDSEDLWLAFAVIVTGATIDGFPSDYTDGDVTISTGTAAMTLASARRTLEADAENPGTFPLSGSNNWAAATVAVRDQYTNSLIYELDDQPDPGVDTSHYLRIRARTDAGSGEIRYRLFQGSTLIASLQFAPDGTMTLYEYELLEAEAALITDYTNLQARIDLIGATGFTPEIDLIQLAQPSAGVSAIGKNLNLLWDDFAVASDTATFVWDQFTVIGDTTTLRWDVYAALGDQIALLWDLRESVGDQVELLWDLRSALGDAATLRWDVFAALGDQIVLRWDVGTTLGEAVSFLWDLRAALGDQISLLWDIEGAIGDQVQFLWDVIGPVGDTVTLRWDQRVLVTDQVNFLWDVRTSVSDSFTALWDVRALANDQIALLWDQLFALFDALTLRWDITGTFGKSVTFLWDIQGVRTHFHIKTILYQTDISTILRTAAVTVLYDLEQESSINEG